MSGAVPNVVLINNGASEFQIHTADRLLRGRWPVGTKMIHQDGRAWRYVRNGGATLTAGRLLQSSATDANHVLQTPTATAAGAVAVPVTLGATAVVADDYMDGYLTTNLGTGFGYTYGVATHPADAGGQSFSVPLATGYSVITAIPATANSLSLIRNPYRAVIQVPVTTITGTLVGVAMRALTSGQWGFIQSRGYATVYGSGTLVLGDTVGNISVAGAVEPLTGVAGEAAAGLVQLVASTTNYSVIFLMLD
jgi:hypothetical protein